MNKFLVPYIQKYGSYYDPYNHNTNSILNLAISSNQIVDDINNHTILNNGLATISGIESPYTNNSILFNGQVNTGLVISSPQDMNFDLNDFTVEFMLYPYAFNGNYQCFFSTDIPNASSIWIGVDPSSNLMLWAVTGTLLKSVSSIQLMKTQQWTHIAVTRNQFITTIWKNGQMVLQYDFRANLNHGILYIGETNNRTQQYNGLMAGFRVTKNISLYNNEFGIP